MKPTANEMDPRDLIGDSFRIEEIGVEDCRSIFFDWALGLAPEQDAAQAAAVLLELHQPPEDHPMTKLLKDAVAAAARPKRRRGRSK